MESPEAVVKRLNKRARATVREAVTSVFTRVCFFARGWRHEGGAFSIINGRSAGLAAPSPVGEAVRWAWARVPLQGVVKRTVPPSANKDLFLTSPIFYPECSSDL
jgi:hypothetical protein